MTQLRRTLNFASSSLSIGRIRALATRWLPGRNLSATSPLILALLLLGLTSVGCQEDRPATTSPPVVDAQVEDNSPSIWSETIGSAGGSVLGANAAFVVPANALSSSVNISMAYNPSLGNEVLMGPSGQTFAVGCTLTIDKPSGYDTEATYHIYLWDPTTSSWIDQGGSDNGDSVSATIWHFSKYEIRDIAE